MNTQTQKTHPRDKHPTLSVHEYLWLECEKNRIEHFEKAIIKMQYRQDRQAGWIILLLICVMLLSVAVIALSLF